MPEGTNHEAINAEDITKDNEQLSKDLNTSEDAKSEEAIVKEEPGRDSISEDEGGDSSVAAKGEPFKKYPRKDNRSSRFGQSTNGNFDSKESQRHTRFRKKICRFCIDKNSKINYRDSQILANYITDRGKILPRRITGTCAKHQREISKAIKRARILAVLPFSVK